MKKDKGTQFLCKDCEKYSLCEYYHCRKEDSYICKYFHLPNKLDKIRAEIDQKQYDFMVDGDYNEGIRFGLMLAYQIIDKYKAESEVEE